MNHHLLKAATKWLVPFFHCMGIFMLIRGHNDPGGGFIGGLVMGAGFVMQYMKIEGNPSKFKVGGFYPFTWIGCGLIVAICSGLIATLHHEPYMKGIWQGQIWLPVVGLTKFGTPFYFDIGVFLVVVGVITKVFLLLEEELWKSS